MMIWQAIILNSLSRVFGVGGTSNKWSQVYSLFSETEMNNSSNKNIFLKS